MNDDDLVEGTNESQMSYKDLNEAQVSDLMFPTTAKSRKVGRAEDITGLFMEKCNELERGGRVAQVPGDIDESALREPPEI